MHSIVKRPPCLASTIVAAVRAPVDHIHAPPFPARAPWVNVAPLRMDQQLGRPVLIEFWDFCRPNSMHTLPYMRAWHERYADAGLRVIGAHASGFEPSTDPETVKAAVARLGIPYPVLVDTEFELWQEFGNLGWPARYLFDQQGRLFEYHYGEGDYDGTERAIQELLGVERPVLDPARPQDAPGALLAPQSDDVEGPFSGAYEAGEVWAVLDGAGTVAVQDRGDAPAEPSRTVTIEHPGAYELVRHEHSTAGRLALEIGAGVRCHAVCFAPGLAE
jgi:thiol-disulfide isomerase/thioredoxin